MTDILSTSPVPRNMLAAILFATGYALFFVFFPWDVITKADGFWDFDVYVALFDRVNTQDMDYAKRYGNHAFSLEKYYVNERLWFEIMRWLTAVTGEAAIALRLISFFIVFVWAMLLARHVGYTLALLFLLNPWALDIGLSIIRNGLAWTFFMLGLAVQSKTLRPIFFLAGIFTHVSTLALVIFYYAITWFRWVREFKGFSLLFALGIGIAIGCLLTVGIEIVGAIIDDRRLSEGYASGRGGIVVASFWGILLCLQCTSGRRYIEQNLFVISILSWYLVMNLSIPWSYRIWGALLPVIAVSVVNLPADKRKFFLFLYVGFMLLKYMYWTKLYYYWYPL